MFNDEDEATEDDSKNVDEPVLVLPPIAPEKEEARKSQIGDFFKLKKIKEMISLDIRKKFLILIQKSVFDLVPKRFTVNFFQKCRLSLKALSLKGSHYCIGQVDHNKQL